MSASGPLAGVRVVELPNIGPVQFAGMLLADMGAEVLRLDRATDVAAGSSVAGFVSPYSVIDRGRRSVGIDLKHERGAEVVLQLCEQADVLLEGFRPGVAERLGVGPDACRARNPKLVYARMTGWGQDGPMAQRAGHDMLPGCPVRRRRPAAGQAGGAIPAPSWRSSATTRPGSAGCGRTAASADPDTHPATSRQLRPFFRLGEP
jgi:alpha-methylacyl-CoA racemase